MGSSGEHITGLSNLPDPTNSSVIIINTKMKLAWLKFLKASGNRQRQQCDTALVLGQGSGSDSVLEAPLQRYN